MSNLESAVGLTLVTLADERYALPLAVLGRSLTDNLRPGLHANLYIADGGITPETKEHLIASWDAERLSVRFVPPDFGTESALPVWGRLPALTYARVFLQSLLPQECSKAILLDSDVVVLTDVGRLWDLEIGDQCLLAVQDPAIPFVASRDGLRCYRELGIPAEHQYFNTGVMAIDLNKWKSARVSERVMEFVCQHMADLNNCEQDGLNAVLFDKWGSLDPRWQVQPRLLDRRSSLQRHLDAETRDQLRADPWLLHFSGRLKPWLYRGSGQADRIFFRYVDRTWWRGWRPRLSLQSLLYGLYDSGLRDWLYPIEQRGHSLLRNLSRRSTRV